MKFWCTCFQFWLHSCNTLVEVLVLDLSKAFDRSSCSVLLNKLKPNDIDNKELQWFTSPLFYKGQVVEINKTNKPQGFFTYSGNSQGSMLWTPPVFFIFFNDFLDTLSKVELLMYVDDTVIYFAHRDMYVA